MNDYKVKQSIYQHYQFIKNYYSSKAILAVCLVGSQNYGIDDENSDVDSVVIVIPSTKDYMFGRGRISKEYVLPNGEHTVVKDVVSVYEGMLKGTFNMLELLYSKSVYLNARYSEEISLFRHLLKYKMAEHAPWADALSVCGMGLNQKKNKKFKRTQFAYQYVGMRLANKELKDCFDKEMRDFYCPLEYAEEHGIELNEETFKEMREIILERKSQNPKEEIDESLYSQSEDLILTLVMHRSC
jgi:predicted nucleotidyltransferase